MRNKKRSVFYMKKLVSILLLAAMVLSLAACGTDGVTPTAEPTEAATQPPTAAPTEAPTPEPTAEPTLAPTDTPAPQTLGGLCTEDADRLTAFFEIEDSQGIKNGDKLFNSYKPNDPSTWTVRRGENYVPNPCFESDAAGNLTKLDLTTYLRDTVELAGTLTLENVPELTRIYTATDVVLDNISVKNCPKLSYFALYNAANGNVYYEGQLPAKWLGIGACGYVRTKLLLDGVQRDIMLVVNTGVGCVDLCYFGEGWDLTINTHTDDEHTFGGWYSETGFIYSSESKLIVNDLYEEGWDEIVLQADFSEKANPFPMLTGERPIASSELTKLKENVPYKTDLDFDGKKDTVLLSMTEPDEVGFRSFLVTITLGSEPDTPYTWKTEIWYWVSVGSLYVLDCDINDNRLDVLFCGGDGLYNICLTSFRVKPEGHSIAEHFWGIELQTDDDGMFDPTEGIPVMVRTEIMDTQYVSTRITVTDEGFMLLSPMYFWEPTEYNHGWRPLFRDMRVHLLMGTEVDAELTLKAGTRIAPYRTDGWTYLDLKLEDGRIVRVDLEIRGYEVYLDGIIQDKYVEIWVAE